jgi:hypothetical protein
VKRRKVRRGTRSVGIRRIPDRAAGQRTGVKVTVSHAASPALIKQ